MDRPPRPLRWCCSSWQRQRRVVRQRMSNLTPHNLPPLYAGSSTCRRWLSCLATFRWPRIPVRPLLTRPPAACGGQLPGQPLRMTMTYRPSAGLAHHRQVLPLVPVTEPLGMKRRRSFSNDEEQSTHITNTIGIISRPVQIHAPVQVLQRPPSSAGSSRLDISHGGWTAVSSNATTAALDPETVVNLLRDPAFRPGARPSTFSRSLCTWVFKEGRDFHIRGKAAAGRHSDRWCANLPPGDTCSR